MKNLKIPDIRITLSPSTSQKPVDWRDNEFIPCEDLFSGWDEARDKLNILIKYTSGLETNWIESACSIGLRFPVWWSSNQKKYFPEYTRYPSQYQKIFISIYKGLLEDYVPDLQKYMYQKSTDIVEHAIKMDIKCRQEYISSMRGRDILDEFSFRLGVSGSGISITI